MLEGLLGCVPFGRVESKKFVQQVQRDFRNGTDETKYIKLMTEKYLNTHKPRH